MLWKHQQLMLDFANTANKGIVYSGMGTGKTRFALEWLNGFRGMKLAIIPKPAFSAWSDDCMEFFPHGNHVLLTEGTSKDKAEKLEKLRNTNTTVIVNYETAIRLPLQWFNWEAVVLDEGHRVGTYNSKTTLFLTRALHQVSHKVIMTGTPYHDGMEKLYGMVRFLFPDMDVTTNAHPRCNVFGHYNDFLNRFCITHEIQPGVRIINGYKNIPQLAQTIKPFTLQIKSEDVLDLPDVVERHYSVELQNPLGAYYRQLEKESVIKIEEISRYLKATHPLTKLVRLQQLATNGSMEDVTFSGIGNRIEALRMLLDSIPGPVVIFTRFKRDIDMIQRAIDEKLYFLTGDLDNHLDWKKDGRILVVNIGAGSEAVRLEKAQHIIFWSVGYSNREFNQAKARIRRPGQKSRTVWYHYITSKGTIDETIYKALNKKDATKERLDNEIQTETS